MKGKSDSQIKKLIVGGKDLKLKSSNIQSDNKNSNLEIFFKKKINFISAFDHKGSKHFLHSKKIALQQIIIDDDDFSNNGDTESGSNKDKKHLKYIFSKPSLILEGNRAQSSNNLFYVSNYKLKNKAQDIEKHINQKNKKEQIIHTFATKKYSPQKHMNKNFSSQELRMFEDKTISKIKPIKKIKNNNENDNNHKHFPFVESENSSVSSLFKMVSQIK